MEKYGRLTVLRKFQVNGVGQTQAEFRCDCGTVITRTFYEVKRGNIRSCGCLHREQIMRLAKRTTHGMSDSPEFVSWTSMLTRCNNPAVKSYRIYGGRGIKVHPAWQANFATFLADMGERPPGTTLDRIDTDGDYEPGNCRWATKKEQSRNKRTTRLVTYRGEEVPLVELAERSGMPYHRLYHRLGKLGWSVEDAVNLPRQRTKRSDDDNCRTDGDIRTSYVRTAS